MHIVSQDDNNNVRGTEIPGNVDCVLIGSNPNCHVYLPDIRIAENHLCMRKGDGDDWWLETLEIPENTPAEFTRVYVNAIEATEPVKIKHNDHLMIASFQLVVFTNDATENAPKSAIMEDVSKIRQHPLPAGSLVRQECNENLSLSSKMMDSITSFSFELSNCLDLASLIASTISGTISALNAHKVWIGIRRRGYGRLEFVEAKRSDGTSGSDPARLETFQYRCTERGQQICCPQMEEKRIGSVLCVPLVGEFGKLGMLYVENKPDAIPYSEQDLDCLAVIAIVVTKQLERVVHEQIKRQEAIEAGEWSFMRELQAKMDPTSVPQWDGLQLAVYCKPGLESAGNIYDVMRLPNGLAAFMCGHIKGSPTIAALAMAEVRASFRMAGLHADPPHVLLRALNWLLHDPQCPASLATSGIVMNPKTGAMQFATAGETGAVIIDQKGDLRKLTQESMPEVGEIRDFMFHSQAGRLHEGETIVLYTPGCISVTDSKGECLTESKLLDSIADSFGLPASTALDELLSELESFFKHGRQPDDITIMVLHRE